MIYCSNCGTQNATDAVFCANCGAALSQSSSSQKSSEQNQVILSVVANKAQEWNNKFLSFLKPFLETIDNGSFFRKVFGWLYLLIAILNILLPLYLLFKIVDLGLLKAEGKYVFSILITWLVLVLLCWFGFQLWWDRRIKVTQSAYAGAEFVATPVLAHFIQTIGEWYGIFTGVLGFIAGLLSLILGGSRSTGFDEYGNMYRNYNDSLIPLPAFFGTGWTLIFFAPIAGFLIIVVFRFMAELIKAMAAIANNTRHKQ